MYTADFWLNKCKQNADILCAAERIEVLNKVSRDRLPKFIYDLAEYPAYVSADYVLEMINEFEIPLEQGYISGTAVGSDYFQTLQTNMNLAELKDIVQVEYGFTLKRANIRAFPTADFFVNSPDDCEFDRFQETALDPAEPLAVLHQSADREWLFVQAYNYRGWINADSVAKSRDRNTWLRYFQATEFLVVTGNKITIGEDPHSPNFSGLTFAMGAKLPLVSPEYIPFRIGRREPSTSYIVLLPVRDDNGLLDFCMAMIPKSADVNIGYLPYSRAVIIKQAFKLFGDRYGWGGLFGSRDCSALVLDVFRSVGILLARNAGEQALGAGINTSFSGKTHSERIKMLASLPPASTLHFPGHVMLYLGEHEGNYYVLHAIAGCGDETKPQPDGTLAPLPLNSVMVTDLNLRRKNGTTLLESITEANTIF